MRVSGRSRVPSPPASTTPFIPCPESEGRHQIRGRLDDACCVAPPRNSANYPSSSRLASVADPLPTLATDFRSGTLVQPPGRGGRRSPEARERREADVVPRRGIPPERAEPDERELDT